MNTTRIKVKDPARLKLFCFIIFFMAALFLHSKWLYSCNYSRIQSIVVSSGDSLWNIASRYKSDKEDIRSYIYKLKEINALQSGEVYEGQVIKVPVMVND